MRLNFFKKYLSFIILIFGLAFWITLLKVTPYDRLKTEHELRYERYFNKESDSHIFNSDNLKDVNTLKKYSLAVFIFGFISFGFILFDNESLEKLRSFLLSLTISIIFLVFASIYYSKTSDYSLKLWDNYEMSYYLINSLPFCLVSYKVFRYLYRLVYKKEPKMTGSNFFIAKSTDWKFSLIVLLTGGITGVAINLIEKIKIII